MKPSKEFMDYYHEISMGEDKEKFIILKLTEKGIKRFVINEKNEPINRSFQSALIKSPFVICKEKEFSDTKMFDSYSPFFYRSSGDSDYYNVTISNSNEEYSAKKIFSIYTLSKQLEFDMEE